MTVPGLADDEQTLAQDVLAGGSFAKEAAKLHHWVAHAAFFGVGVHCSASLEVQRLHERRGLR